MAYLDALNRFHDNAGTDTAQTLSGNNPVSSHDVDTGVANFGKGDVKFVDVYVTTALANATSIDIMDSADGSFTDGLADRGSGAGGCVALSRVVAASAFTAGKILKLPIPPDGRRYYRLRVNGTGVTGAIKAFMTFAQ